MKAKKERKRGRRNEGWITEQGGVQYAHIKYSGVHYCESARSALQKDAQRTLDTMRKALLAGTYLRPRERAKQERAERLSTVAKLAEQWLETRIKAVRNPRGRALAAARVKLYLAPFMGTRAVAELGKGDLREYRLWVEAKKDDDKRKLSATTVGHVLSDARNFLLWCEDEGFISRSPFPRGIMPKIQERAPKALPSADAEKLAAMPDPYGFACRIMLGTGVRWGELVKLQASSVKDGRLLVEAPKTKTLRRIPIAPALLQELKGRVGKLVPFEEGPDYFAFVKAVRKLSGLDSFGAHQLRHTFALRWLAGGGSLAALQLALGHSSIETTMVYAKITDDLVAREAERLWAQEA